MENPSAIQDNDNSVETGVVKESRYYVLTLMVMIAAGGVFIWQQVDYREAMRFMAPSGIEVRHGEWYGLFTSIFAHGDVLHIFFNLSWIWLLGRVLESNLSRLFWVLLFVTCGVFSSAAEFAFTDQLGIGLSGVVYGWAGFVWFTRSRYPAFHGVINKQTAIWLGGWLVFCFLMTNTGAMHIANGAHLGGLVAGSLIGFATNRSVRNGVWVCLGFLGLTLGSLWYAPWSPLYNALEAVKAFNRGEFARARKMMDRVPTNEAWVAAWAIALSADINSKQGNYQAAKGDYKRGEELLADDAAFLNAYAWLLATCPQAEIRDGSKAVQLALKAVELTGEKEAGYVDTLAAAYAEEGDFESAVKWQTKAVALEPDNTNLSEHLELFRKGQPFREEMVR